MYSLSIILYIIIYSYSICIIKNQSYLKYIELAGYITFLKIMIPFIETSLFAKQSIFIILLNLQTTLKRQVSLLPLIYK